MDWEPSQTGKEFQDTTVPPSVVAPAPAAAGGAPNGDPGTGARRLGRKISHKKSASDTFAFAAGQLFQHTPEDFYNLLETPLDYGSGSQTSEQAGSAARPSASQLAGLEQQQHGYNDSHHQEGKSASFSSLRVQVPGAALNSLSADPSRSSGGSGAGQPTTDAAAAAADTAEAPAGTAATTPSFAAMAHQQQFSEAVPHDEQQQQQEEHEEEQQHKHKRSGDSSSGGGAGQQTRANALDTSTLDPRRAKRILANRQSAQRSRMKRLQYIHDLENRSATASATVKELQGDVERLQEQHAALGDVLEARKEQVATLAQQLSQEQALQAALMSHIAALRSQAAWQQQQQQQSPANQQQHWPHQQHHPAQPSAVQLQQLQQPVHVKQEQHLQDMRAAYYAGSQQQQQQHYNSRQQQDHQQQYQYQQFPPDVGAAAAHHYQRHSYQQQQQQHPRQHADSQQHQLQQQGYPERYQQQQELGMQWPTTGLMDHSAAQPAGMPPQGIEQVHPGAAADHAAHHHQQHWQQQQQQQQHQQFPSAKQGPAAGPTPHAQQSQLPPQYMGPLGPPHPSQADPNSRPSSGHGSNGMQQQQQSGPYAGAYTASPGFLPQLHRAPSPLSIGLAGSESNPIPDLEDDEELEGQLDGLLMQDSPAAFLSAGLPGGLSLAPSGELQLQLQHQHQQQEEAAGRGGCVLVRQGDIGGGGQPASGDLRKTLSM